METTPSARFTLLQVEKKKSLWGNRDSRLSDGNVGWFDDDEISDEFAKQKYQMSLQNMDDVRDVVQDAVENFDIPVI